jgi:hypothetical protein
MSYPYHLSLKKNVCISVDGEDLILTNPPISVLRLGNPTPGIKKVLEALCGAGGQENALCDVMVKEDGLTAAAKFYYYLGKLDEDSFLCRTAISGKGPLTTLVPTSRHFRVNEGKVAPEVHFSLSRFAYLRQEAGEMVLESPLGHGKLILRSPEGFVLLHKFSKPTNMGDLVTCMNGLALEEVRAFLDLLLNLKAIWEVREADPPRKK